MRPEALIGQPVRFLLAALIAIGGAAGAWAQGRPGEYDVKAAYLYKFAPFVEWPSPMAEAAPLVICVAGHDPFGAKLDSAIAGQLAGTHPLTVRRMARVDADSGCHILFVGGSREQPAAEALKAVAGEPILTVTDETLGSTRGMIHFAVRDAKIRFHIDAGAANRGSLSLSSKLLALALSVKP